MKQSIVAQIVARLPGALVAGEAAARCPHPAAGSYLVLIFVSAAQGCKTKPFVRECI